MRTLSRWAYCGVWALLSSCGGTAFESASDAGACEGQERCPCYGNGTCDEGLACLSQHCVRLGGSADGGADPTEEDPEEGSVTDESEETAADDTEADAPPASDTDDTGDGQQTETRDDQPGVTDATEPDATEPAASQPEPGPSASDATDPDGTEPDATEPDGTEPPTTTEPDPTEPAPTTSEPSPPRQTDPVECEIALDPNQICVARAGCQTDACAVFEYVWAVDGEGVLPRDAERSLQLQDVSEDGKVLLGSYREQGVTIDAGNVFVWSWGEDAIELLASSDGSSAVAINGDGRVVVGHDIACDSQCSYTPTRWTDGEPELLPSGAPVPYAISDDNVVIGYTRVGEQLQSFVWNEGEPQFVNGTALMVVDSEAKRALGVNDDGDVVLWEAAGSRPMPAGPNNFDPQYPRQFNRSGELAIGTGWDGSHEGWFLWELESDSISVTTPPLAGYDGVMPADIDEEGRIVVGQCLDTANLDETQTATIAFFWDAEGGMRSFEDELSERGVLLPAAVRLQSATLSHDGTYAIGSGFVDGTPILWRAWLGPL